MKNQFDLVLSNPLKLVVVGVGCFVLLMAFIFSVATNGVPQWIVVVAIPLVLYGLYRLVREFSSDAVRITIEPDKLLVLNKQSGQELPVLFANISSYRYQEYNGSPQLRFKLRDGSQQEFQVHWMHRENTPTFKTIVQAFEAAMQAQTVAEGSRNSSPQPVVIGAATLLRAATENAVTAKPSAPEPTPASLPIIVREKIFFEKPASTVALVAMVAVVMLVVSVALTSSKPLNGSLISSLGVAIGYIGAWYAARQQRYVEKQRVFLCSLLF